MKTIVIAGRPNVGKSTLFNRLLGQRRSIVHDRPGITRDVVSAPLKLNDLSYELLDTGGFVPGNNLDEMDDLVREKVQKALDRASLVMLVFDARSGFTVVDQEIVNQLRSQNKTIIGIVNKVDPGAKGHMGDEFFSSGIDPILEISAEHGLGIETLREEILGRLPGDPNPIKQKEEAVSIAFLGRPNVGKSSLVNAILNEPRQIVSEQPGTTRDVVDIAVSRNDHNYVLLDTAGLRKRYKISDEVERFSTSKTLKAVDRADIVLLVLDATEDLTNQDEKIAAEIIKKGKGLLVVVNKWDLKHDSEKNRREFREDIFDWASFLQFASIRFCSALTGMGVDQLLVEAWRIKERCKKEFSQSELDMVFDGIASSDIVSGRLSLKFRITHMTQGKGEKVPTFFIWCTDPRRVQDDFERFWANAIHEALNLEGVPIRVTFRRKPKRKTVGRGGR